MPARETNPIAVPSKDPKRLDKDAEEKDRIEGEEKKDETKESDGKKDDLTVEERQIKEHLEELVEIITTKVTKSQEKLQMKALEDLRTEIMTATSSMTSVPLPLKFLQPHYDKIKRTYDDMKKSPNKTFLADILSVLAMTMGKVGARESLKFRLQGTTTDLGSWGHEYVRNLAGEIGVEWEKRVEETESIADLEVLVDDIVPFKMRSLAEFEAFDLLMEVEQLHKISKFITKDNQERVCAYALSCADYVADAEEREKMLGIVFDACLTHQQFTDALRVAIKLGNGQDKERIIKCFSQCDDPLLKKQMGYILAAQRIVINEFEDDEDLTEIIGNVHLNSHYLKLAKELDVREAKSPEDIYKSHLEQGSDFFSRNRPGAANANVDSARQNLASTFVNAFVNCSFGKDNLITPEGSDWLYKNKTHGMLSAAASLGMIMLCDVDTGFSAVDKYSFSAQNFIKAGALLATGMLSSGVSSELDAAYALLAEHVESDNQDIAISAVLGLGLAYAGSAREDVLEILVPLIVDDSQTMEVVALTCLSLGLVYVGTANEDISGSIVEAFLDRSDTDLKDSVARHMCLGMGLLFLGQGDAAEAALAAIAVIQHPISQYLELVVTTCAYVGSANVLEIQKLVSFLSDHIKEEEEGAAAEPEAKAEEGTKDQRKFKAMAQEVAVLGIASIAMGEELAAQMALRALDHILQYGELNVRRTIPLALGFLSISNPQLTVMDTISKLTHDQDQQVSQNAILALGFLGAGTNNARAAGLLRQLAAYYAKEANHLFLVRIAQGLLHMGKGLVTLNPFHSDRLLMSHVGMAGLLTVFHAALDLKNSILSKRHYLLFALTCSIRPRMLVMLDEEGEFVPVSVRVGQAVDVVAQAGKPKTITGFQTHSTPVLLAAGERAELATDEYITMTSVLEGFVIVKKNPNSVTRMEEEAKRKEDLKNKK